MKILLAAVAFAGLFASPVLAQAQTDYGQGAPVVLAKQKKQSSYCDPYSGSYWDNVAPYGSNSCPDPYAGTRWEGWAPY